MPLTLYLPYGEGRLGEIKYLTPLSWFLPELCFSQRLPPPGADAKTP